jgi:hypothetical protein
VLLATFVVRIALIEYRFSRLPKKDDGVNRNREHRDPRERDSFTIARFG